MHAELSKARSILSGGVTDLGERSPPAVATGVIVDDDGKTAYVPVTGQQKKTPGDMTITHLEVTLRYKKGFGYVLGVYPVSVEERTHSRSVGYAIGLGGTNKLIQSATRMNKTTMAKLWAGAVALLKSRAGEAWELVQQAAAKANVTV